MLKNAKYMMINAFNTMQKSQKTIKNWEFQKEYQKFETFIDTYIWEGIVICDSEIWYYLAVIKLSTLFREIKSKMDVDF